METKKDFSCMPGPWGLPFLGSASQLITFPERTLMKWARENYGDVFRYRMLGQDCVVLNGYEAVKEGLVGNKSSMSGRITSPALKAMRDNQGLFFIDYGEQWKEWKPFVVKAVEPIMNDLPRKISREAEKFEFENLKDAAESGIPIGLAEPLKRSMAQVVLYAILDKEVSTEKRKEFDQLISCIYEPVQSAYFRVLLFVPWLSRFPPFSSFIAEGTSNRENMVKRFINWIEEDRKKTRKDTPFPSITEQFYAKYPDPTSKQLKSLALVLIDLVFAGSATTANQLLWVILYLMKHPQDMKRVQLELSKAMEEVEDVAELYRLRQKVPFTLAVIQESLRLRPIAPDALYHKTIREAHVGGYNIPKGVVVHPNLWSVHHDPKLWGPDPEEFKPERHIDDNGEFKISEFVIPFSIGERRCPGDDIARADIFIFLTSILLKYDLKLSEDTESVEMTGVPGAILKPPEFKALVNLRK